LQDAKRPIVIFNRVGTTVDSVSGQEVGNRQEVQFLPRRQGVVKKNELLTSAAKWFRQQCDAEDKESDAFRDLLESLLKRFRNPGDRTASVLCALESNGRSGGLVRRRLLTGTFIRLMRYEAEKEGPCVALDW
jgi:hypothetical protein